MAKKLGIEIFNGGNAQQTSFNPFDGGTAQFNGASHENGGIDMTYGGNNVEVEGGETAIKDNAGDLHIMGNMTVPGTKTKFKQVSKAISKQEEKYGAIMDKGMKLVDNNNPKNKFERMKFNTGKIMMEGATQGMLDLATKKNSLAQLQTAMLDTAHEMGVDSIALSEGKIKAKYGAKLNYEEGGEPIPESDFIKSLKKRFGLAEGGGKGNNYFIKTNTPGMTAFGKYQFTEDTRKGIYNKYLKNEFKNAEEFDQAFKTNPALQERVMTLHLNNYINKYGQDEKALSIIHRIGEGGYQKVLKNPSLMSAPIKTYIKGSKDDETLDQYMAKMKTGIPGASSSAAMPVQTDVGLVSNPEQKLDLSRFDPNKYRNVDVNIGTNFSTQPTTTASPNQSVPNSQYNFDTTNKKPKPYQSQFDLLQVMPEILAIADNQVEAVPAQKFQPLLFQPYQQSFQDRMNRNTATFNAIVNAQGMSPSALSTVAAQKYEADAAAQAEEFRVNQGIANQVYNQNIQLLNDAQLKNLQIADIQAERQAKAKSNTKAQMHVALSSIADKYIQHKRDNLNLIFQQEMFNFRPVVDDNGRITGMDYQGPDYIARNSAKGIVEGNKATKTVTDAAGNVKTSTSVPSDLSTEHQELQIRKQKWDLLKEMNKGLFSGDQTQKTIKNYRKGS